MPGARHHSTMIQEPVIFENQGQKLFGMLHIPEPPHVPPFPALVMLHGFTGHKIEPHRLFVKAARRFASEGILTLRFDFRGCGESEGDFEDLSVEGEVGDALKALELVRGRGDVRQDRIGLLGMSLGGSIAACVAGTERDALCCLVLWAAVADPRRAFGAKAAGDIMANFGKRPVHDYFGNALSQGLLDELYVFRPLERLRGYASPAIILHGDADTSVSPDDALLYEEELSGRGDVELHMIRGSGHTFAGLAWEKELIDTAARFLGVHLS
ncbi:MAG: alpha/beta hydrolase [Planctomycetota bacterium]